MRITFYLLLSLALGVLTGTAVRQDRKAYWQWLREQGDAIEAEAGEFSEVPPQEVSFQEWIALLKDAPRISQINGHLIERAGDMYRVDGVRHDCESAAHWL